MKIYDTFPFDAELDLLEHRLHETFDLVDFFVLVKSAETYKGDAKRLHFHDHRERFLWAASKLRPIALPRRPGQTPWARENFQRDAIALGLLDAQPEDLVLILDADEIPSRSLLERLRSQGLEQLHRLTMTRHYGRFDWLVPRSTCCPSHLDPFPLLPSSQEASSLGRAYPGVARQLGIGSVSTRSPGRSRYRVASTFRHRPSPGRVHAAHRRRWPPLQRHRLGPGIAGEALASSTCRARHTPRHLLSASAASPPQWPSSSRVVVRGTPEGPLPEDLMRFEDRLAESSRVTPLPPALLRHAVRSWFWTRVSKRISDGLFRFVDTHFEAPLPVSLLPLLLADGIRRLSAAWQSNSLAMRYQSSQPVRNSHG